MIHNDVLRRLRFALSLNDNATLQLFKLVDYEMPLDYLKGIMCKEEESGYIPCRDKIISLFLDALIIKKRGKQEGKSPKVLTGSQRISNNEILRKIKIAMNYKDEDVLQCLKLANFHISKSELSAFFRKVDHRNYKECGDQLLRNLLQGMVKKYRTDAPKTALSEKDKKSAFEARKRTTRSKTATNTEDSNKQPAVSPWGKVKAR
jgi:uncharacterized protein YehS (DUF1456 family)